MTTSLVTGAAGFIGGHVARHLLEAGHNVVAVDDLSGGYIGNVPIGAKFVEASIVDDERMRELFNEYEFDYVFHLAAYAAEGLSHFIRRYNYTNNVVGSATLINVAVRHEVKRFVFTSSMAVYGSGQVPFSEFMVPQPEDPYGVAKYAVELDLRAALDLFGLRYTVFRPHNVYGEGQNIADRYRNVVGIFMNHCMQGEPMPVYGDGLQTRAFSHIDDVAPVIASCIDVPASVGQVFNIGADRPYTVLALADAVAEALEVEPKVRFMPARHEVKHAHSSHERVRQVFGDRSTVELADGLERMAKWAQIVGPRRTPPFTGIELTRGIPPHWLIDSYQ